VEAGMLFSIELFPRLRENLPTRPTSSAYCQIHVRRLRNIFYHNENEVCLRT